MTSDCNITSCLWTVGSKLLSLPSLVGFGLLSYYYFKPSQIEIIDLSDELKSNWRQNKVLGLAMDLYCQARLAQDELAKKIYPTIKPVNFLISRIWEIDSDRIVLVRSFDQTEAQSFHLISFETLGLEQPQIHGRYLIEYYWQNNEQSYLLPCPGQRLKFGLDTQGDWLTSETGPEDYSQIDYQLSGQPDFDELDLLLFKYAGPGSNFYQTSDFEVTGRELFCPDQERLVIGYDESITVSDPILEEEIVFQL